MFTIVVSVTHPELYAWRLKQSLAMQTNKYKLILTNPKLPLSTSYNSIGNIDTKYVMFVHEDIIFMSRQFLTKAEYICNHLKNLGVAGLFGMTKKGDILGGHIISPEKLGGYLPDRKGGKIVTRQYPHTIKWKGKEYKVRFLLFGMDSNGIQKYGFRIQKYGIREARTLDDPVVMIPSGLWNNMKFDERFPFHFIVEDYCIAICHRFPLRKIYCIDLKTWRIHSASRAIHSKDDPWKLALKKFGNKWRGKVGMPICTHLGRAE